MRILVADDHEVMRKGACAILTTGFNFAICDEASDGQEAIAKALDHKPDIIILDVNMRGLGGFEAAKEIHRVRPDVPILFFTMHGEQFLSEAKRAGAQGFVKGTRRQCACKCREGPSSWGDIFLACSQHVIKCMFLVTATANLQDTEWELSPRPAE